MLLVPDWQQLNGLPLPQIVAHQWARTIDLLVADLECLPSARVRAVDYGDFLKQPGEIVAKLTQSVGIGWDRPIEELPLSRTTVSRPSADKWKQVEGVIEAVWPIVAEPDARARAFAARRGITLA